MTAKYGKASAIRCRHSVGNRRHAYSFPICTIHFAGKQGFATVATTLKQMAKSSATAWQSFYALGLPAKYRRSYPPEFVVRGIAGSRGRHLQKDPKAMNEILNTIEYEPAPPRSKSSVKSPMHVENFKTLLTNKGPYVSITTHPTLSV